MCGGSVSLITSVVSLSSSYNPSLEVTFTLLINMPTLIALTLTYIVTISPASTVPRFHTNSLPLITSGDGVADINSAPSSIISFTTTPVAAPSPMFLTVIVYFISPPYATGSGLSSFIISKNG